MEAAVERFVGGNTGPTVARTRKLLLKALGNVVKDPGNEKFRKLRTTNSTIKAKVVDVVGAVDVLRAAGFEDEGEFLVVSMPDVAKISEVVDALRATMPAIPELSMLLPHASGAVRGVAVDADGTIGTASMDNLCRLWAGGAVARELAGHTAPRRSDAGVSAICFGAEIYSGGRDGALISWKRDGTSMTRHVGHGEPIEGDDTPRLSNAQIIACVCALDASTVLTGGWDRTVIAWDVVGDALPRRYGPFGASVNGMATMEVPEVGVVAALGCGDGVLYTIDPRTEPASATLGAGRNCAGTPIRGVAACPGRGLFATASNDQAVRLWAAASGGGAALVRGVYTGGDGFLFCVAAAADAVFAGGDDGVLFAFALPSLDPLYRIPHPAEIWALAVAPPGSPLAGDVVVGCEAPFGVAVWTRAPDDRADNARLLVAASDSFAPSTTAQQVTKRVDDQPPEPIEGPACASKQLAPQTAGTVGVGSVGTDANFDFSFPVDLGQGREALTIKWNRGDEPNMVAFQFLQENRLPTSEHQTILDFIAQAQGNGIGSTATQSAATPSTAGARPTPEAQSQMVDQVMSLGVDETKARDALQATQWTSVEAAISSIFG